MESRVQIVQKFAIVAEHPEQCYDFDIQGNLSKFFHCERSDINFSEAAFLVYDAARIYGRKVDYFEQILLDFNQRSATNVSKALAEVKAAMAEGAENSEKNSKDKKAEEAREKREREKERALKRAKRMIKVTTKVEFKPKPFEIATSDQISLNIHEQRSEFECEEEFDQLRMKNVFPRINVLQSNLQNNNTFYDNLGIEEGDVENLDSLRDFRIFMDTIDEPIFTRPMTGNKVDPKYEQEYKRSIERANQKHSNIYLPADYIKENYGITIKDNSDYLNMLKYNEEVERLNLRKLTIEQLSKLKVGTYLNNILHGNKQDGKIAEHDSGIDIDDMERDCEPPLPELDAEHLFDELSTMRDELDVQMTDELSINETSKADDTLNLSVIPIDETPLNTTEQSEHAEQSQQSDLLNTTTDSALDKSGDELNSSLEISKDPERTCNSRQSLDDGIGASECNSPSHLSELDSFEGFNSTDLTATNDINQLVNDFLTASGDNSTTPKAKVPELDTNIFALPEKLLRRTKIFALTDEFELWMAARKRKFGLKPDPPNCGKLLKLSNGVLIRSDPDSDTEEFLGFDENYALFTAPSTVVEEEPNPATITNRTCSSDSGISPEKPPNSDDVNQSQPNGTDEVNDSGIADINSSAETTLNSSGEVLDTTLENASSAEQSVQEADMSLSDSNINANSTKLFNETASIVTGFDSGFSELESQLGSTAGLDETLEANTNIGAPNPTDETSKTRDEDEDGDRDSLFDECVLDRNGDDEENEQREETARTEGFSDMVERVSKWHEMLRPVLANCEKRNNFDIHALGTDIIDLFPQEQDHPSTEISFTDVMKGRDQTYTARYFLSLLLLTNNKNIHLNVMHPEQNGKVLCSKDDIRIKLQSRTRHLDEVNKIDQHLKEPKSRGEPSTSNTINITQEKNEASFDGKSVTVQAKQMPQNRKRKLE